MLVFHLYVVATPIGNLEDITLRSLRILKEVKLIAAEDTRTSRKLLSRYGIKTPLISFHEHNQKNQIPRILGALTTGDVALVSDAGVPTLSDPGQELVRRALESGVPVSAAPGPSAVSAALSVSGMPANRFMFTGFLPRRQGERRELLRTLAEFPDTVVIFEAPHRLRSTLKDLLAVWGDRRITVCRELTKRFEEVFPATVSQALERFAEPRGEFTLVVEGGVAEKAVWDHEDVRSSLAQLKVEGMRAREAVSRVAAESGMRRSLVYREWLALGEEEGAKDNDFT